MVRKSVLGIAAALAMLALPAFAQQDLAAMKEPAAVVGRVNEALLSVMQNAKDLGFQGRYEWLAPVLEDSFAFPFMARATAGRHWSELDETQKAGLAEAFQQMSISTYAARFDGYSGQKFEIGDAVDYPRGDVLVRTRLVKADGDTVSMDYLLREFEGDWRIVDIILDGSVSEIATKRSEYGSVIKNEGIDGLLNKLSDKAAALAEEKG